jgi:hypothetical protein
MQVVPDWFLNVDAEHEVQLVSMMLQVLHL